MPSMRVSNCLTPASLETSTKRFGPSPSMANFNQEDNSFTLQIAPAIPPITRCKCRWTSALPRD